jgi:transcriptional regulator with XRE-family HTH domain
MSDHTDPCDSGTESSNVSNRPLAKPYQDEERLRELYHDEDLSQSEIAERLDTDQQRISYWMCKFGIETDADAVERAKEKERKPIYSVAQEGKVAYYEHTEDGPQYLVSRHQLVALLWYDPEEVFDEETHVHHIIGAMFGIDVPENLLPLDRGRHAAAHQYDTANFRYEMVLQNMRFDPESAQMETEHSPNAEVTQQGAAD